MIIKASVLLLLLVGHIALASTDYRYPEALQTYERQEYHQALQMFDRLATSGNPEAQYMLGQMHEAGHGTLQDFVEAHKWYNLAAARGHRRAAAARDAVAARMTAQQISEAQQTARAWQPEEAPSSQAIPPSRPDIETLSGRQGVAEIQRELNRLGYDAGPADGVMGRRTRNAIHAYQADMDMAQDGHATSDLLRRLRQTERVAVTATAPPPPTASPRIALDDDFSDGDYRRNPAWTVLSGDFRIDRNGLRSVVEIPEEGASTGPSLHSDRPEDIGLAMLKLFLEQRGNVRPEAAPAAAETARIFVSSPIRNAFEMELELASRKREGSLEMGVFQGSRPGSGYRLVYRPGARPGLSLIRVTSDGSDVIASSDGAINLEDDSFHILTWTRAEDGEMQISVDGRRVIQARDTRFRERFQGFVLANHGGDYSLGRIRVED
ncbi:peptidoglycan-binding protein [Halomonas alkalisoli]|uniref:peptidoglycan-binding protein n=1 Tax=Halomonas alkalisoli TaxID=2907158 RepID=UPI001F2F1474|nr:peptidoglycan-binding protein [Halomonas alkalisoli]